LTGLTIGLFIVTALLVISPMISAIALLGFGTIYLLMSVLIRPKLRRNAVIIKETNRSRIQAVQEGLGGIREVLIENAQKVYLRKFAKVDNKLRSAQGANALFAIAPKFIAEAAGMVLLVVLVVLASKETGGISHSLPVVGALALGAQRLLPLLQQLYNGWANLLGNGAMLIGVVELLRKPLPSRFSGQRKEVSPLRRVLELRDVSFRYSPELPLALRGVDMTIPRGARVGIAGPSGSGKTTLMDLLMGLLQPTDGSILVDGTPLNESNIVSWQKQLAHVPQHIFLLDGSIAENVAFGCAQSDVDRSRVHEACRLAQLDEFISALPDGYDSLVGERGVRLSGGQRQRIGIARALYGQASVLVLDEATSALDDSTEANVIQAVERLGEEYTILMIAHRITTLRGCDMICRLDQGRIVETGTYAKIFGQPDAIHRSLVSRPRVLRPSA
jgi:ABC-type multidrug transport system fused ATPase/permease subunit